MKLDLDPVVTPETRPYWDGLENGELRLRSCNACDRVYFPPGNVCPHCSSKDVDWSAASGRATLYSYVINEHADARWGFDGPMSVAMVLLEEGPSLLSTVINCPQTPEALRFDMPLQAVYHPYGEGDARRLVLCFEPVEKVSG